MGPPTNLPHASKASWPRHQDSRSRRVHGARPSALGSVPSAVGFHATKTSPILTSPDLDERAPNLVFCCDSPPATRAGNSQFGRHGMPSNPEAATRTRRRRSSGHLVKGSLPACLGRGPLHPRTVVGCDIFIVNNLALNFIFLAVF